MLQFVTATDERIARVEQLQTRAGEGPCHEVHQRRKPVIVEDLRTADQWAEFTPAALEAGMASAAGIPLAVGEECIGALNPVPHAGARLDGRGRGGRPAAG